MNFLINIIVTKGAILSSKFNIKLKLILIWICILLHLGCKDNFDNFLLQAGEKLKKTRPTAMNLAWAVERQLDEIKKLVSRAFPNEEIFEQIFKQQPLLNNVLESLTKFTKSINIINGGIKDNVVPDKCEAIIDFRLLPGQDPNDIINALKISKGNKLP